MRRRTSASQACGSTSLSFAVWMSVYMTAARSAPRSRAGEQPRLPAESETAQSPFGGIVGQANPSVFEEAGEGRPARQHVVERLGDRGVARQLGALGAHPGLQRRDQIGGDLAPDAQTLVGPLAVDVALDVEDGVDAPDRLQGDRRDRRGVLAAPRIGGDVGQFEELAPARGSSTALRRSAPACDRGDTGGCSRHKRRLAGCRSSPPDGVRDVRGCDRARRRTAPPAGPCRRTAGRRGHRPRSGRFPSCPWRGWEPWCRRRAAARRRARGLRSERAAGAAPSRRRRPGRRASTGSDRSLLAHSARSGGSTADAGRTSRTGSSPAGSARRSRAASHGTAPAAARSSRIGGRRTARAPSGSPSIGAERPPASRSRPRRASTAWPNRSTGSSPAPQSPPARAADARETACGPAAGVRTT